jgi:hypothetical protein
MCNNNSSHVGKIRSILFNQEELAEIFLNSNSLVFNLAYSIDRQVVYYLFKKFHIHE